jgi:hypothetical protein
MSEHTTGSLQETPGDGDRIATDTDTVVQSEQPQLVQYFHDLLTLGTREIDVARRMGGQGYKLVQQEAVPVVLAEKTNEDPHEPVLLGVGYPDQVGRDKKSFEATDLILLGMNRATTHEELGRLLPLIEHPLLPDYIQIANRLDVHRGFMYAGSSQNNATSERRVVAMALTQLRMALSLKAVTIAEENIVSGGNESVEGFVSWLEIVKPTMPLVGKVESRCREILRDQSPDRAPGIFAILRGIEERGISDTETDKHVVLAAPTLLAAHPEVAEMLQRRLSKEMAAARDEGQEQTTAT